ncbi:hypothetical protein O3M35_013355 [Rhynocoris fuscipes]|uniref:Nitrate/nitrite sensing protein domain-containing protein n=1 Tax=Rhynocoris fuscipes TaxID=488301 RepID=A0AAW1CEH1_9HEMI
MSDAEDLSEEVSVSGVEESRTAKWCGIRPDPAEKKWRKCYLLQMLVLPFIPIVAVILQTALSLRHILHYRISVAEVEMQVTIATELGKVVTQMQLERSEVAFYIFTNGHFFRSNLTSRFAVTDQALDRLSTWPMVVVSTASGHRLVFNDSVTFRRNLDLFRYTIIIKVFCIILNIIQNFIYDDVPEEDNMTVIE